MTTQSAANATVQNEAIAQAAYKESEFGQAIFVEADILGRAADVNVSAV